MNEPINEVIKEKVENIFKKREEWLYQCLTILHPGVPFDKTKIALLIKEQDYYLFRREVPNLVLEQYLAYREDYVKEDYLKYIAKFRASFDSSYGSISTHIDFSLPKKDDAGNILKTKLIFGDEDE